MSPGPDSAAPRPGAVDLDAALARLGGDVALYEELYSLFCDDAARMLEQVAELAVRSERREASRVLHGLKGLAGTIGAVALAGAAERAQAALRGPSGGDDACVCAAVREAFMHARQALEQALHAMGAPSAPRGPQGPRRR